jgi:uracil-DNA glycosylase
MSSDYRKSLGDSEIRVARRKLLHAPHVAPLTAFVGELRQEIGSVGQVPDFDPWDGGVRAECLFLLEAPGAKAVSSGFVSRNNPDQTAKTFFELNQEAGIPRSRTVTWNIVPWYISSETRIRAAKLADIGQALPSFERLLGLLSELRIVVLIGRKAERAKPVIERIRPDLPIRVAPHPSPLFVNRAQGNRQRILEVLVEVARVLGESPSGPKR